MKYQKSIRKKSKLQIVCILFVIITACHIYLGYILVVNNTLSMPDLCFEIITLLVSYFAVAYTVIPDILKTYKQSEKRFDYKLEYDIPFVDRKEILTEIIESSFEYISNKKFYYIKNLKYREKNGKSALAKRLCYELQKIKDHKPDALVSCDIKLGNIHYIDYSKCSETFVEDVKSNCSLIKGKKNIIVVKNSCNTAFCWDDELKDNDIFFIFFNFNNNSEDKLFFSDDKIYELLLELKNNPKYQYIYEYSKKNNIRAIAAKLGFLSHNNIGTIVDILSSNEFETLLETDDYFLDFYFEIKNGNYSEAKKLYEQLPLYPKNSKTLIYKRDFELANLNHFLGNYEQAFDGLKILLTTVINDQIYCESNLGKKLYIEIILLQSHIKKHLGYFSEAKYILTQIPNDEMSIHTQRASFSIEIFYLNEFKTHSNEWAKFLKELRRKMSKFKELRSNKDSDFYFYETYYPIVKFYSNNFNSQNISKLIRMEDKAIKYYIKNEKRYLTNCYFIKAELYRISEQWENAEEYYNLCYDVYCNNGDRDILYLLAYTIKAIFISDNINIKIDFDIDKTIDECKQSEGFYFHQRLISELELAERDLEIYKEWKVHFHSTINPIP